MGRFSGSSCHCLSVSCFFILYRCVSVRRCVVQLGRQSHNGKRLPAKFANISKINSSNSVDSLRNPLFPSISTQSQAKSKSHGQRQLSAHETSETPRNQASERLELPLKGDGDEIKRREEEEAKEHRQRLKSIHLLKRNKHRAWDMIEA